MPERQSDRFYISLIPDNTYLSGFAIERKGQGCRLDICDVKTRVAALSFDLTSATYMSELLTHLGHTNQIT